MLYTAWAGDEAEGVAKYEAMRERLMPLLQAPAAEERYAALSRFADDF